MVKSEKFNHLHLIYHFTVPLMTCWDVIEVLKFLELLEKLFSSEPNADLFTASSLLAGTEKSKKKPELLCLLCNKNHKLHSCKIDMYIETRRKIQNIASFVTITNEIYRHTETVALGGHNHTQVAQRNIQWTFVGGYLNYLGVFLWQFGEKKNLL